MADGEIHVGDIGTSFEVEVKEDGVVVDISGISLPDSLIKVKKTDGTIVGFVPVFVTDGADGLMEHRAVEDDIDQEGEWQIQGLVYWDADNNFNTEIENFQVYASLELPAE